jgi:hypothetical protein
MSERTTFRSAMTGWSMILARRAALSPSVLWRTLRGGLPADMILQKKPTRFAKKKKNPKMFLLGHKSKNVLVRSQKLGIITAVKMTFSKRTDRKISHCSL